MAKLINGDGNKAIYADQDADLIASICGNVTCIAAVGGEYAATQEDANTIGLADGVIITKEGRRIQLDTGYTDLFDIPTGTAGVTNYYIIGYHLYINDDNAQVCETFVQKMNSSSETITEDTFKGGATDVYVSVYRVTQVGLNISTISLLLAKLSNISKINSDLADLDRGSVSVIADGTKTYNQLLTQLWNSVDQSKLTPRSVVVSGIYYYVRSETNKFSKTKVQTDAAFIECIEFGTSSSIFTNMAYLSNNWSLSNNSSAVPTSGTKIELFY